MNKLREQIKKCMYDRASQGGKEIVKFRFPREFAGFDGHFPGNPVLPGVCLLQAGAVILEMLYGPVCLREIAEAKFYNTVLPDEEIQIECVTRSGAGNIVAADYFVRKNGRKAAFIRLKITKPQTVKSD